MSGSKSSGGGMDLLQARVKFRDRSVSDVLDLALRFIVVQGRLYAKVALVSLVPLTALSLLAGYVFGWGVSWLIALPLAVAAQIPFTVLASRLVFERDVRVRDVMKSALSDAPIVLFVRALAFIAIVTGFVFLLVPGVWLSTIFLYTSEVLLLERGTVGQAFGRSQRVASNGVGDALFGLCLLLLIWVLAVNLADIAGRQVIGELLQFRPPQPYWTEGGSVLATLGLFAIVPYLATARFFLYLNVRTRSEGWDIQTRFAAIAARAEEEKLASKAQAAA